MPSTYSLTVLGSDIVGLSLAQKLTEDFNTEHLALVGSRPGSSEINRLGKLLGTGGSRLAERFPESLTSSDDIGSVVRKVTDRLNQKLGWFGGEIVDLAIDNDGFSLLVRRSDGSLSTLHTRYLLVTAPAGTDVLTDSLRLPGTDSAVTGLLIDRTELSLQLSRNYYEIDTDGGALIWDFDFGFEIDETGCTSNMRVFVNGQAASGPSHSETLSNFVEALESLGEPADHVPEAFDPGGWQDASMPEGFVDTKIERLRDLLGTILRDPEVERDALSQELEGIAGEVDSYSRFRSDPDLQRLRWKTLTVMNLARPFLVSEEPVNA